MDEPPISAGRRRVLATMGAAGAASLAGCSLWDQTGATDVLAHNAAAESKTVSVTITETGADEPHTSRTLELDAGETVEPVNRSKSPTNASYTVEASVEDGPSETFDWDEPKVELAPLYVFVDDSRNIKFLLQAG